MPKRFTSPVEKSDAKSCMGLEEATRRGREALSRVKRSRVKLPVSFTKALFVTLNRFRKPKDWASEY